MLLCPLEKSNEEKKNQEEAVKKEAEQLRKEFLEMVESKLRREEKDIWFIKNHEHLNS